MTGEKLFNVYVFVATWVFLSYYMDRDRPVRFALRRALGWPVYALRYLVALAARPFRPTPLEKWDGPRHHRDDRLVCLHCGRRRVLHRPVRRRRA